ncbi:tetratricopeptide repeat protein [Puia dinghuensis]|uniref:Tetratricopeptide repeat protein n=1 Tax=Puia dinghuensis TaxID=1792502 RepID=A0A8J2XQ21_9BACT|nr:tetratricopeptide repeat protein [Puia dinghuensis]GGA81292.1 hypothetical protein GCM10011511_00310 [Puia dinghuensis]
MNKPLFAAILCVFAFSLTTTAQKDDQPVTSGQLMEQASNLYDSGQYKKAIAIYRRVDRSDTNYVKARYAISESYYYDSQYDASLEAIKQALASISTDAEREPEVLNHYGNVLDAMGKYDEALQLFDSAIRKYPSYALFYSNKGTTLIDLDRLSDAEAVFKQALLIDPYSYACHFKLGYCALQQGKLVPAMFSFMGYLLMIPEGRFRGNCIRYLSSIANNEDTIQTLLSHRKEDPDANYQLLEQIIQSKIALDKNYKPLCKLDDPLSRQMQVVFEKMEYDSADHDFWMQYYLPYYKSVFTNNNFELFVNRLFSGIDLPVIQDYVKKNKKELEEFKDQIPNYFDYILTTREVGFTRRFTDSSIWTYSHGKLIGRGVYDKKKDQLRGPWEFYYSPGNLKAKGIYDMEGHKEGLFSYYFFNGKLKGTEFYKNGKENGEDYLYFSNGQLSTHSWYKDGQLEGESTSYYWVGSPQSITHYHEGTAEGVKISFNGNGDTTMVENYHKGLLDGPFQSRYKYGTPKVVCTYKDDKLDGDYKKYYPNGQLEMAGVYKAGKQEGEWKTWFQNGQLKTVTIFVNDNAEGGYKEYFENGVLFTTYTAKKGKINGDASYYDEDGKLYVVYTYNNGVLQKTRNFDKSGKEIATSTREQKAINLIMYRPDGSKSSQATYSDNGDLTGTKTSYYLTGEVIETEEYRDGIQQGARMTYFANGNKKAENHLSDGKLNGYHRLWYQHGQLQEEGQYADDELDGNWVFYNELGAVTDSIAYSEGNLEGYKTTFEPNGKRYSELKYYGGWIQEWVQYDTAGKELRRLEFPAGNGRLELIYPGGNRYVSGEYRQSQLVGPYQTWYFDGKPNDSAFYKKGRLDGKYTSWFHNGVINTEGLYAFGDKTGLWKYHFNNGNLRQQETYIRGDLDGEQLNYYYEGGKLQSSIPFKEGNREGWAKYFEPGGALLYQVKYHDGDPIAYTYKGTGDSLLPEMPIVRKTGKIKTYFSNGKVSAELEYRDGVFTGEQRLYYPNGQVRSITRRQDGILEGEYAVYWPDGKLSATGTYLHDNLHGNYKEYNEKGVLYLDMNYYCGNPHGPSKIYGDDGHLLETDLYHYGQLIAIKK